MAITREQKVKIVEEGGKDIGESKILLFTDFKGMKVGEIEDLRTVLRKAGVKFRVIKKRLIRVMLKNEGIDYNPVGLEGQIGVAFTSGDISEVAGPIHRFSMEHNVPSMVGGVDVQKREEIPLETIIAISKLPSREVLLSQVIGSISAPLRGFMYILKELENKN